MKQMEASQIQRLTIAVNQFYLSKYMDQESMDDLEFDSLREQYEREYGSVKDLVEWEDVSLLNEPIESLEKYQITDNDLGGAVMQHIDSLHIDSYTLNYKYDGSSIIAYYDNGRLKSILGTPDETYGIVRTKSFWDIFPHTVDKSIKALQGEVLVDAGVYGKLARNKANGLTNSKHLESEVANEAFIRVYRVYYHDNNWSYDRQVESLNKLTPIIKYRVRPTADGVVGVHDVVFSKGESLWASSSPKDSIIEEVQYILGDKYVATFQVDGVVLYYPNEVRGFKFYFTESAVTTVIDIQWNVQSNGSFAPVILIDPVTLDGKYIQKVSANGVPRLLDMEYGVGAKVRVILANTTIPKIIETITSSDVYNYPQCDCGYRLSAKDIYGSTLKCSNKDTCSYRKYIWESEFIGWIDSDNRFYKGITLHEVISIDPIYLGWILHIDRWDPYKKINKGIDNVKLANDLIDCIDSGDYSKFDKLIESTFNFSDLQYDNYVINSRTAFDVLQSLNKL